MESRAAQKTLIEILRDGLRRCLPPRIRSMREFAEQEIVIPNGPFEGRLYTCDRQPYSAHFFALVDSGQWNRVFATGCTQSGKTLTCFVIPTLYHLFEVQETVIILVPQMEIARDKWNEDILPAIERSRYRDLLPLKGAGSKGAAVDSIRFRNGTTLKFMSGGGSDKKRSAFTSRVVVITEVDGMDEAGESSREADKITQVEARTLAYGSRKRIYGECTVSIEQGRTWQEYKKGTETRLVCQCKSCKAWVTPEREDVFGWHDAANILEARQRGQFNCPSCGVLWENTDRQRMNRSLKAIHRGQEIDDAGTITGDPPKTDTLGFRWNAFNNLFWDVGDIAAGEWSASKADNQENAEKEQLQFKWAKPYVPDSIVSIPLDAQAILARSTQIERGVVPANNQALVIGCDIGKYLMHWVCVSWSTQGTPHVVSYGEIKVHSDSLGIERAVLQSLHELHAVCEGGFNLVGHGLIVPQKVFIDSGYQTDVVYSFCRSNTGGRYWSIKGFGTDPRLKATYSKPLQVNAQTKFIGDEYHVNQHSNGVLLVNIDVDYWKTYIHKRLTTPLGLPGAMTLHAGPTLTHSEFARHLTSEKIVEEFVAGKGVVKKWVRQQRKNHYFDAVTYCGPAGHMCGVRLVSALAQPTPVTPPARQIEQEPRGFVRASNRQQSDDTEGGWIRRRK